MWFIIGAVVLMILFSISLPLMFRRVVSTNEVHVVQSTKKTTSYGKGMESGNTYYEWPAWVPYLGVSKIVLPVSVFALDLANYEAYDKGRLPFIVDVMAFFRIKDSNTAAQRVSSFEELEEQLQAIVQGAIRTILASSEIEEILQGRSKFGEAFTNEVKDQLVHWGVEAVKNIELMDIRDSKEGMVIRNIMEKKKSFIAWESRQEVAKNNKNADIAEIEAKREVDLQKQAAALSVGLKTAEVSKEVDIAKQIAAQGVKEQEKATKEKEMAVLKVQSVRTAEIEKEVKVVAAQQSKETAVIIADGQLEAKKREAEGITATGEAKAKAEKAMQLAPVEAQITLAKEIGGNASYQQYLVTIKQIEAAQTIGVQQADALGKANIKIIANSGNPVDGVTNVMDMFSAKGGTKVAALLEGLAQSDLGKSVLEKLGVSEKK